MADLELKNKVVLITGSTGGIGRETALLLAEQGMEVYVNGRDKTKAQKVLALAAQKNLLISLLLGDATDESFVKESVKKVIGQNGRIDVLINNVGACERKPIENITLGEWDSGIRINLTSIFLWSKEVIPHMKSQMSGHIVSIASTAGIDGLKNAVYYNAAKGGIIALTSGLSKDLLGFNIAVDAVAPGAILTEGLIREFPALKETKNQNGILRPVEVAKSVFSLLSSSGTGRVIVLDNDRQK